MTEGKKLPYDTNVEQAVLSACLIDFKAFNHIKESVSINTFYKIEHQEIFRCMGDLYRESKSFDMMSLSMRLREEGKIKMIGGTKYLVELMSMLNSAANIQSHAMILAQLAVKREMIGLANSYMEDVDDETKDPFELLDEVEKSFFNVSERNIKRQYRKASEIIRDTIDEIDNKCILGKETTGIDTGFQKLNENIGGWQNSELTIIAARPGMGKTAFVVSTAITAAKQNYPIAIFSLEMSQTQLMTRIMSAQTSIPSEKLRKGNLTPFEMESLEYHSSIIGDLPIFIDDTPSLSVIELRAKARRLKERRGIKMVVVDYLQLMESGERNKSAEQEVAHISRSLKTIAKELNVPVLALSQLSRAVESRGKDKKPQLSDLRSSGSIEQDADLVMFLYRPEYYGISEDEDGESTREVGQVIIAKNRSGMLETIKLRFIGELTKFEDFNKNNNYEKLSLPTEYGDFGYFESQEGNPF